MEGIGDDNRPKSRTELLLRASLHFLENHNFRGCRKYALQAAESDTGNNPFAAAAAQILAVSDILAATKTRFNGGKIDWYGVLGVDRYTDDPQLIRENFKRLVSLLNPNKNKIPFADEAFGVLREAWSVLSDGSKKTQFDNELRILESRETPKNHQEKMKGECGFGEGTFWTICPYCYYVYEYHKVYEECCMRCQNQSCGRGFQAVAIPSPPPEAVVRNGHYWCLGFSPVGFEGQQGKKLDSWTPFTPLFTGNEVEQEEENVGSHGGVGSKPWTEGPSMVKPVAKRIKTVAGRSKKVMGKGIRVRISDAF